METARVLPEAIRLVELRARSRGTGHAVGAGAGVGDVSRCVLSRELDDVASVHAEELAWLPGLSLAMRWRRSA